MSDCATAMQCLTFTLCSETYALEVSTVREALEMTAITAIPRSPAYLRGVINVRGSVVPVVDLRLKLGISGTEKPVDTCAVVLMDVPVGDESVTVGAVVDAVQEVVDFDCSTIQPPPRIGTSVRSSLLVGIAAKDDRFVMILDIRKVFAEEEIAGMAAVEENAEDQPTDQEVVTPAETQAPQT